MTNDLILKTWNDGDGKRLQSLIILQLQKYFIRRWNFSNSSVQILDFVMVHQWLDCQSHSDIWLVECDLFLFFFWIPSNIILCRSTKVNYMKCFKERQQRREESGAQTLSVMGSGWVHWDGSVRSREFKGETSLLSPTPERRLRWGGGQPLLPRNSTGTRGNGLKLDEERFSLDIRKHFFLESVNALEWAAHEGSGVTILEVFKKRVDRALRNIGLVGMVILGWHLDVMISVVFSSLNKSMRFYWLPPESVLALTKAFLST